MIYMPGNSKGLLLSSRLLSVLLIYDGLKGWVEFVRRAGEMVQWVGGGRLGGNKQTHNVPTRLEGWGLLHVLIMLLSCPE